MRDKKYNIKVFSQDGTTVLGNIALPPEKSFPTFSSRINGVFSECVLDLNYPFDDFEEGGLVDFINIVEIDVCDESNPLGRLLYKGYVSRYEPYIIGGEEGVRVTLLGLGSLLSTSYYKNGGSTTVTHGAQDPETIGRAIIDHFSTIYGGSVLSYSGDTTDPVGTNVSIEFIEQKWFDALKKTHELAGEGWWWKIDEEGRYWLKAKPATATHRFTIGKDIDELRAIKDSEKVVNDVEVKYDGGTATASDATSQQTFGTGSPASGKRSKIISATELQDAAAGQQRADKEVDDGKDARVKATIVVNDNYDIESIKVGECCEITNFRRASTFFGSNVLQIVSVQYLGHTCRLELEDHALNFSRELSSLIA